LGTELVSPPRPAFLVFLLIFLSPSIPCSAQVPRTRAAKPTSQDNFQQHYDAARTFQISGDEVRAAAELVANHQLRLLIAAVYPVRRFPEALRHALGGAGKVLLDFTDEG